MKNVPDNPGNAATEDRFAGQLSYRGTSRREIGGVPGDQVVDADAPRNGASVSSVLDRPLPSQPSMSLTEVTALTEPVFTPPDTWLDIETTGGPVADHPLLRGLLQELPPKGSRMPQREWLDRWFEATRSILELLYVQERSVGPRPRR